MQIEGVLETTDSSGLLLTLDPQQQEAVTKALTASRLWVHGEDLTKRMQVLGAMVWNALMQGKTSLICVPPEMRGLVHRFFEETDLRGLCYDLSGGLDASVIGTFQIARRKKAPDTARHQATVALREYNRWMKEHEDGYRSIEKVLFGELTWRELVEQRCGSVQSAYQHLLSAAVHDRFDLTHKEYWYLRGRIKSFARLRTLRTSSFEILEALNPKMFDDPAASLKDQVISDLTMLIAEGRKVLCTVADAIHAYDQDICEDHQNKTGQITARLALVQQRIAAGETRFGPKFFDETTLTHLRQSFVRNFRPDLQELHLMRRDVRDSFMALVEHLQSTGDTYLDDIDAIIPDPMTMEGIAEACIAMQGLLGGWSQHLDAHASVHRKRINAQNTGRGEGLRARLAEADAQIGSYIATIAQTGVVDRLRTALFAQTGVLRHVPEINALSLDKKAAAIEQVIRLCIRLLDAAHDIDAYTLWTNFWTAQNPRTRSVLKCLDLMEDNDLVAAFDTWYFDLTLSQVQDPDLVGPQMQIAPAHARQADLKNALVGYIRATVQNRRYGALREIASTQKMLIQSIAKARVSVFNDELRVLPARDMSGLFPVLICTPDQIAGYGYYYDTLMVCAESGHDHKVFASQAKRCVLITEQKPRQFPDQWVESALEVPEFNTVKNWQSVPVNERLPFLGCLAGQFVPFLEDLRVFNGRHLQIFSFLGDKLGDSQTQGDMYWQRKRILYDQDLRLELV